LIQAVSAKGVQVNPIDVINLYVSLKTKSLVIVTGLTGGGKRLVAEAIASTLAGDDPFRLQVIGAHPQWVSNTGRVVFFAQAQSRLMIEKFQILVEEARMPCNKDHLFIMCLMGISPAELYTVFIEIAEKHQRKNRKHVSDLALIQLAPLPPNLLIIGTMDTNDFDWLNPDHYSQIGRVMWPECEKVPSETVERVQPMHTLGDQFLQTRIVDEIAARGKLDDILDDGYDALQTLQCVRNILSNYAIQLPQSLDRDLSIYLANAWSSDRLGLFSTSHRENLTIATDLAIAQTILPRIRNEILAYDALQKQLQETIAHYPHSSAFLEHLQKGVVSKHQGSYDSSFSDPVCGMTLEPTDDIMRSHYQGQLYYFCSHNCKITFDGAPEKFIHGRTED